MTDAEGTTGKKPASPDGSLNDRLKVIGRSTLDRSNNMFRSKNLGALELYDSLRCPWVIRPQFTYGRSEERKINSLTLGRRVNGRVIEDYYIVDNGPQGSITVTYDGPNPRFLMDKTLEKLVDELFTPYEATLKKLEVAVKPHGEMEPDLNR